MAAMTRARIQQQIIHKIKIRYVFAVALIAIMAITTFLFGEHVTRVKSDDYKIINLSGRQRMLSQKIALLSGTTQKSGMSNAITEFRNGFDYLKKTRFVSKDYPEIFQDYQQLDTSVQRFLTLASGNQSPAVRNEIFLMSQELLRKFDEITLRKQFISEKEFKEGTRIESIFLGLTLLLLFLEIIFIFKPMTKEVLDSFEQLNQIEDKSLESARLALIGHAAASIGHEIKNPLFAILTYSRKPSESSPERMEKIHRSAVRMQKIIEALSVQARDTSRDEMEATDLKVIIEDALDMLEARISEFSIEIYQSHKFQGRVYCRQAALSQVIANLISNAIDAVKDIEGTRIIWIESNEEDDGVYVRVRDNGEGVPVRHRDEIFKTFFTTKKQGSGTGLGLAFCKKIMEEHKGDLVFRSDVSASCFEMKLPKSISSTTSTQV